MFRNIVYFSEQNVVAFEHLWDCGDNSVSQNYHVFKFEIYLSGVVGSAPNMHTLSCPPPGPSLRFWSEPTMLRWG